MSYEEQEPVRFHDLARMLGGASKKTGRLISKKTIKFYTNSSKTFDLYYYIYIIINCNYRFMSILAHNSAAHWLLSS